MNANARKIAALCGKDLRDLARNPTMLVSCLMPVAFMVLYRYMFSRNGEGVADLDRIAPALNGFMMSTAALLSIAMVGSMVLLYGLAEEKEKHTLRTLMLANVGAGQIMAAKLIITLAITALAELLSFLVIGAPAAMLPAYLAIGVVGALPILLVAALLGLASRDQMTSGLYAVPLLLVAIAPMFAMIDETFERIVVFLPTGGLDRLFKLLAEGTLFGTDAVLPVAVTAAWIVVCAVAFTLLFRRLSRDN